MPSKHIKDAIYDKVTKAHIAYVLNYQRKIKDVDFLALCIEVGLREMTEDDIQKLIFYGKTATEREEELKTGTHTVKNKMYHHDTKSGS